MAYRTIAVDGDIIKMDGIGVAKIEVNLSKGFRADFVETLELGNDALENACEAAIAETLAPDKPSIERLFEVHQTFMVESSRAGFNGNEHAKAREAYKVELEKLGIADAFDWSDE